MRSVQDLEQVELLVYEPLSSVVYIFIMETKV